jgi:hypothetical protein
MGILWSVAFGGTSENLGRTLQKLLEPRRAGYIRPALLVDSFLLHRIHHCLPCTYGQSIAPLHRLPYCQGLSLSCTPWSAGLAARRADAFCLLFTRSPSNMDTSGGVSARHLSSQGICELHLLRDTVSHLITHPVVYIIAPCSSLKTTTFCLFRHVCSVLTPTVSCVRPQGGQPPNKLDHH